LLEILDVPHLISRKHVPGTGGWGFRFSFTPRLEHNLPLTLSADPQPVGRRGSLTVLIGGRAMSRRLAIVFGGSRGIGAACVDALLADGHDVAWTHVSETLDPDTAGRGRPYRADVRDAAQVAAVFENAARDFGVQPACVVVNAGINVPPAPI